jgi:hypothetical protein
VGPSLFSQYYFLILHNPSPFPWFNFFLFMAQIVLHTKLLGFLMIGFLPQPFYCLKLFTFLLIMSLLLLSDLSFSVAKNLHFSPKAQFPNLSVN